MNRDVVYLEFLSIFPLTKYELLREMDSQQSTEFVETNPAGL